jgi:hypothetical protein
LAAKFLDTDQSIKRRIPYAVLSNAQQNASTHRKTAIANGFVSASWLGGQGLFDRPIFL